MFKFDFEILDKNIFGPFVFIKNNLKTIQKLYKPIIEMKNMGTTIGCRKYPI